MITDQRWVLLAEDDDDIRQLIHESLKSEGKDLNLQIVEAKDGVEAITIASNREFHCVVTDLKMPRSSGEDFIRAMQTHPLNANTPTLVITGHGSEEFSEKYSHIKVIPKPFMPSDLARSVIREIKLGRMDDRIAVHLINPFVLVIREFLENSEDLALPVKLEEPSVKKAGEGLVGDVHCTLTLQSETIKNRFTLSFDKELLEYLRVNYFQTKIPISGGASSEITARQICQHIYELVSPQLKGVMGGAPRLVATSIITYKNEAEYAELVRGAGVNLVCRTEYGRIIAGAFSKAKSRRV